MKLTSRERIMRIFRNQETDRPAFKLWGAEFGSYPLLHRDYEPVAALAQENTDLFGGCGGFPADLITGANRGKYVEQWDEDTSRPTWKIRHTVYHTPLGDLHQREKISTIGEPGYTLEYCVKEPEDIEKLLSMEYTPYPVDRSDFDLRERRLGDKGVTMISLPHAAYTAQTLMGSETLAYFCIDYRQELAQLIGTYADRRLQHTKRVLDTGVKAPFAWVGPELFLPPLVGPEEFREFVYDCDKPLCDLIHEAGCHVWVHSHGSVNDFIESFIGMGVDVLNPIEPAGKGGDVLLDEVVAKFGNRIGWEGNIEIKDILLADPQQLRALIDECVRCGAPSGRFILCPSAGFNEYVAPTQRYIENLRLYLTYGLEAVEKYRR
ncbi:MAG: hypothetical protein IJ412_00925 [Oscillospiraceae bacterium]|nr:hypothetical protein [Oscillospiraceae bacterium]